MLQFFSELSTRTYAHCTVVMGVGVGVGNEGRTYINWSMMLPE